MEQRKRKAGMPREIEDKVIDVGAAVLKNSRLDRKTKALIAVGAAVAARCSHCHGHGANLALRLGASPEEIEEARELGRLMQRRCSIEGGLFPL